LKRLALEKKKLSALNTPKASVKGEPGKKVRTKTQTKAEEKVSAI
jgi:hypothetical protein